MFTLPYLKKGMNTDTITKVTDTQVEKKDSRNTKIPKLQSDEIWDENNLVQTNLGTFGLFVGNFIRFHGLYSTKFFL